MLDSIKATHESPSLSPKERNLFLKKMLASYYKVGFDAYVVNQGEKLEIETEPTQNLSVSCFLLIGNYRLKKQLGFQNPLG